MTTETIKQRMTVNPISAVGSGTVAKEMDMDELQREAELMEQGELFRRTDCPMNFTTAQFQTATKCVISVITPAA